MLALLAAAALAQQPFDAHGLPLGATDGDLQDGVAMWRAERQRAGGVGLGVLVEVADEPLVLFTQYFDRLTSQILLDDLVGAHVQAHVGLHERVAVGVSMPLWFSSIGPGGPQGVSAGDLALAIPVGIVLPGNDGGFGLSLVPRLGLPSGATARFLGNPGVTFGALVAASLGNDRFGVDANVGVDALPPYVYENLDGGGFLLTALGARAGLGPHHAVRAELVIRPSLDGNDYTNSETPGEALLALKGRYDSGLFWNLGGATAVMPGATAARFRAFFGVGWVVKGEPRVPGMQLRILVVDADTDAPIPDATLTVDGADVALDRDARAQVSGLAADADPRIAADHPWYEPSERRVLLEPGRNEATLRLKLKPSRLEVRVRTLDGLPVDGEVSFTGPKPTPPGALGEDGELELGLSHGEWRITVAPLDEGLQTVSRSVSLDPGETKRVEVVLERARVQVTQTEVVLLDKVHFEFDEARLTGDSMSLLDEVAAVFEAHPELRRVEIQGHTDERGTDRYNLELSQRRMESVRDHLVGKGVDAGRLVAKGYGESRPLVRNAESEDDHARNRRVEFHILELDEGVEIRGSDEPAPEEP